MYTEFWNKIENQIETKDSGEQIKYKNILQKLGLNQMMIYLG